MVVTAIYGLNFDEMPQLRWKRGYPLVLVATLMLHDSRRRKWL